jgi:hypothetical protein
MSGAAPLVSSNNRLRVARKRDAALAFCVFSQFEGTRGTRMRKIVTFVTLATIGWAATAHAETSFSAGVNYTSGKYGFNRTTTAEQVPLSVGFDSDAWGVSLNTSFAHVDGPADVLLFGGTVRPITTQAKGKHLSKQDPTQASRTVDGLGDTTLTGVWHAVQGNGTQGAALDLSAGVIFATGDKNKGLSTGETNYDVGAEFTYGTGDLLFDAGAGYEFVTSPTGANFQNVGSATVGVSYRLGEASRVGLAVDWAQSIAKGYDDQTTLTANYVQSFGDHHASFTIYGGGGFSNTSPDLIAGVKLALHT